MPLIILQSAICFRFLIWGLQGTCFAQNETLKSPLLAQLLSRERPSWHGAGARHCRHLGHTGWPRQGRTARGHLGWQYRLSLCCKQDFKALGTWLPPKSPMVGVWGAGTEGTVAEGWLPPCRAAECQRRCAWVAGVAPPCCHSETSPRHSELWPGEAASPK